MILQAAPYLPDSQLRECEAEAASFLQLIHAQRVAAQHAAVFRRSCAAKMMLEVTSTDGSAVSLGPKGPFKSRSHKRHSLYKTRPCKSFNSTGECSYGDKCQFAHGPGELRYYRERRARRERENASLAQTIHAESECVPCPPGLGAPPGMLVRVPAGAAEMTNDGSSTSSECSSGADEFQSSAYSSAVLSHPSSRAPSPERDATTMSKWAAVAEPKNQNGMWNSSLLLNVPKTDVPQADTLHEDLRDGLSLSATA